MFVVAYMAYFSSSLLFANVSRPVPEAIFDLTAAQYAGASISLFSVFLGWFALVPLFETFGLETIADIAGWLLLGALVVGYGQLASSLYRTRYASVRLGIMLPLFAGLATVDLRHPDCRARSRAAVTRGDTQPDHRGLSDRGTGLRGTYDSADRGAS